MANIFHQGETVVCWRNVKDIVSKEYKDPATSMTISIMDPRNGAEVLDAEMIKDETGKYHYDYNVPADGVKGKYRVIYKATDGARVTIEKDTFEVS